MISFLNVLRSSKRIKVDIEDMSTNELIHFIQKNPSILKRPIMIDERRFQVGYNAEEIRAFIPRELRKLAECQKFDNCPQFSASTLVEDYHRNNKAGL